MADNLSLRLAPSADKSLYLLLVAAIAAIAWLGLQMIEPPPRVHRPGVVVAEARREGVPPRIRVVESPLVARPAPGDRASNELDRVLVFESDFAPGEFDVAGVVRYLDWKLDARIRLSAAAQRARERPVRLPAPRATAREVLDRLALVAGLRWELRDGRVWIWDHNDVRRSLAATRSGASS